MWTLLTQVQRYTTAGVDLTHTGIKVCVGKLKGRVLGVDPTGVCRGILILDPTLFGNAFYCTLPPVHPAVNGNLSHMGLWWK